MVDSFDIMLDVTLKGGIEKMLTYYIAEVESVKSVMKESDS